MNDYYFDNYRRLTDLQIEQLIKDSLKGKYDVNEIPDLELDDLLKKDSNGITYLEQFVAKEITFKSHDINDEIVNSVEALQIYTNQEYLSFLKGVKEDILFEKTTENITLAETIIKDNCPCSWLFDVINNHYEIIDYLIKYNQINRLNRISPLLIEKLFVNQDGTFLIDKYFTNERVMGMLVSKAETSTLITYCHAKNNFNILKYASEDVLLTKTLDNKTYLEILFENNLEPSFKTYNFKKQETLNIILKYNKFHLLSNASSNVLLKKNNDGINLLQVIIDEYKKGENINLAKLEYSYRSNTPEQNADILITLAKNDVIGFYPSISADLLLFRGLSYSDYYENKCVLDYILDKNPELADEIVSIQIKRNPDISLRFKQHGLNSDIVDLGLSDSSYSDEYLKQSCFEYEKDIVSPCEDLLSELQQLFYNDGKSNKEYIDALVAAYRYYTSKSDLAILELKQLIQIKKNNKDSFTYVKLADGSYFNEKKGGIHLESSVITTLNHETGHALHHYLADTYIPKNYYDVIAKIRNNPEVYDKIKNFSQKVIDIKQGIVDSISNSEIEKYLEEKYPKDRRSELIFMLHKTKEEKKKEFKNRYSDAILDTILDDMYSEEEYFKQRKEIEKIELTNTIIMDKYGDLLAVCDIIDAIFLGTYRNGVLKSQNGEYIQKTVGHGIDYYSNQNHGFDEMIANYSEIIKSKNSEKTLAILKDIIGEELFNMIEYVYTNEIVKSRRYRIDYERDEYSHAR